MAPKRRRTINKNHDDIEKEIEKIKNPFQMILLIISHPRFFIPILIILFIVLSFITVQINYRDGQWIWEKKIIRIDNTLKIEKLKK